MTMLIPGSEVFSSRPVDPEELRRSIPPGLVTHVVRPEKVDELDPLTYEVVRHRLWSVTDEMGEALKRMSGSPIVTDANDFDFAICDELGQEVQVGLYNTQPAPFLNIIMEPMAGGYGARPHADGLDTVGLFCIPMGRIPDVEMTEFL